MSNLLQSSTLIQKKKMYKVMINMSDEIGKRLINKKFESLINSKVCITPEEHKRLRKLAEEHAFLKLNMLALNIKMMR
jgi:hypothetical protein